MVRKNNLRSPDEGRGEAGVGEVGHGKMKKRPITANPMELVKVPTVREHHLRNHGSF